MGAGGGSVGKRGIVADKNTCNTRFHIRKHSVLSWQLEWLIEVFCVMTAQTNIHRLQHAKKKQEKQETAQSQLWWC